MMAAAAAITSSSQFLAFDFGSRRIGVASGNGVLRQATPLCTMDFSARFDTIAALLAQWQPTALVVGVPRHPDGAPHDNTELALKFARQLRGRFDLPVFEVDERFSTTEALSQGARDADAAAAAIILNQFFSENP
jgi:putative holliday junction resolvase